MMLGSAQSPDGTTAAGFLLVLSIFVPVASVLAAFVSGGRNVERIALATMPAGLAIAIAIAAAKRSTGASVIYLLGGWAPPLGVALRADGLSVVMMVITALVICAVAIYARADFRTPSDLAEARAPFAFWILLLSIWSALNLIFVAGDLFTLYVGLELLTFAAAPLVCLDGRPETFQAALRYLLFALLGSVLYLAGTVLIYGAYGTLDIVLLSRRIRPEPVAIIAAALMTVGLLAKTALFPLHLWLPPAHAAAPAAASAVLSALVVKGPFFIAVRLWFDVMPDFPSSTARQLLATLGAAAIVFGSIVALRQVRLKLLIAYSTLAQIGYLFLMFPLDRRLGVPPRLCAIRRHAAGHVPRHREGRHVHVGGAHLCGAGARPDRGASGRGSRVAPRRSRLCAGWFGAGGRPFERRLSREGFAAPSSRMRPANGGGRLSYRRAVFSQPPTSLWCWPTRWRPRANRQARAQIYRAARKRLPWSCALCSLLLGLFPWGTISRCRAEVRQTH